jgi:hypothetical protein
MQRSFIRELGLLAGSCGFLALGVVVHSFREESITDEAIEGGDLFLHAGGIHRSRAHPL